MYEHGRGGLPQSDALAVEWFRKAADQGVAQAQCTLGVMYAKGMGVPRRFPEALRWLRKAVAQGNENAAFGIQHVQQMQRQQQLQAAGAAELSPSPSPLT